MKRIIFVLMAVISFIIFNNKVIEHPKLTVEEMLMRDLIQQRLYQKIDVFYIYPSERNLIKEIHERIDR